MSLRPAERRLGNLSMATAIGKLKATIKERCPECGHLLQIRMQEVKVIVRGIAATVSNEYICCSNRNCYYEQEVEQKRRRRNEEE